MRRMAMLAAPAAVACLAILPAGAARASQLPEPVTGCPAAQGAAAPSSAPWSQQAMSFSSVWSLTRGAGVTVAVIDSGVDANPQFGGRVTIGPDLAGEEFGVPADADCAGHGTSVAGIIAAAPVAGVSFTGVAPQAAILSVKVVNFAGEDIPDDVTATAIRDAVGLGANVINLSLATTNNSAALRSAVEFALASNVVVVAAAGNDDSNGTHGPFYPAAYPGVLSVGAVGPDGSLASFSDTRTPVTVTAPGVDVTSAFPGTFPDAYTQDDNGTSFAAPFVSGVAALVRARYPDLTAAQVVRRIKDTADGAAGPGTGNGMVNPVQAVTAVLPEDASGVTTAGPAHIPVTRAAAPDTRARTMAMAIAAAALGAAIAVIAAAALIQTARRRPRPPQTPRRRAAPRAIALPPAQPAPPCPTGTSRRGSPQSISSAAPGNAQGQRGP